MSKIQDSILKFIIEKIVTDKEKRMIIAALMFFVMICFFTWLNNGVRNVGPSEELKEQILKNLNNPYRVARKQDN